MTYLTYYKKPTLLEEVFDSFLSPRAYSQPSRPVHISRQDKAIVLQLECPGVQKDDIQISYHDDVLTIKTNKPKTESEDQTVVNHFQYGESETSYRIPDINIDESSSKLEHGVLTITLPKTPASQPFSISVD